jgi:hypothetical protein
MDESNWLAIVREIVQLMFILFLISSLTKTHVIKLYKKLWIYLQVDPINRFDGFNFFIFIF